MEYIKRKIHLEKSRSRQPDATFGAMTADSFYIKVMLTQNMDDMGMFLDFDYIPKSNVSTDQPDYTILVDKLTSSGYTFPFMSGILPVSAATTDTTMTLRLTGAVESDFYYYANKISGATDSNLEDVRSYSATNPYPVGFDVNAEAYINYIGGLIDGVNRVTQNTYPMTYTFDTDKLDPNIGTTGQTSGILYTDYSAETRTVNGVNIPLTTFSFNGEGWNETNTSISALTKEEYLFGIISTPEVQSDVFIDRGRTSVNELHLKMSEINSLEGLENYGNGFFNVTKT